MEMRGQNMVQNLFETCPINLCLFMEIATAKGISTIIRNSICFIPICKL